MTTKKNKQCGLIMPIAEIDGCSAEHWSQVQDIIKEALDETDFEVSIVSDASDVGIIQTRIVQNIFKNEIIVCDVSCKNPNVMFELGLRLAFDKPTIIIKDDETNYSFDTGVIEHIGYPRDLHYATIKAFKETLKSKVIATYEASKKPGFTTFLKHFGEYKVAEIESKEVGKEEFVLQALKSIQGEIKALKSEIHHKDEFGSHSYPNIPTPPKKIRNFIRHYLSESKAPIDRLLDENSDEFLTLLSMLYHQMPRSEDISKDVHKLAIKQTVINTIRELVL